MAGELNMENHRVSAFIGDPFHRTNADTSDDFGRGLLHKNPLVEEAFPDPLKELLENLIKSDGEFFSGQKDSHGELWQAAFFSYLDNYFSVLLEVITLAEQAKGSEEDCRPYLQALDALLGWKCCRVSRENRLMIPKRFPIEEAVQTLGEWLSDICDEEGDNLAGEILRTQKQRHLQYIIYGMDQVYLRTDKESEEVPKGVPYHEAGCLTKLSSVRLIEKVDNFCRFNDFTKSPVRVACLGDIDSPDILGKYFSKNSDNIEVQLFQLERDKGSELTFTVNGSYPEGKCGETDRKVFNLRILSDLEMLFEQYDIVLFTDDGCFYRQGQDDKTIEERAVRPQLKWLIDTARQETKKEDKVLYYKRAYRAAGEWLNAWNSDKTAALQFDQQLFKTIQSVMKPKYNVYLYVSMGKHISGQDLYYRDVCNDENYGGKEISVYKIPAGKEEMDKVSEKLGSFISNTQTSESIIIDLWKLVKSVSDDYYSKFLDKGGNKCLCDGIKMLRDTKVRITWEKKDEKLHFKIISNGGIEFQNKIQEFMDEFLERGFNNVKYTCVQKYLHNLMGNAIVARANDVEGIVEGWLLKKGFFDSQVILDEDLNMSEEEFKSTSELFEPRRTVLSVINNLNSVWIRDYDKKEEYLLYEFRNKYCPNLNEQTFRDLMNALHKACEDLGYTDGRLYNHSKL